MNAINDNAPQDSSQDLAMTPDMYNRVCRNADIERWRQEDNVIGYKITRSRNCNKGCEICFAGEGVYPKSFNWDGWHDGCLCYAVPITLGKDFHDSLTDIFLSGGDWRKAIQEESKKRMIRDYPENFKAWVWKHRERLKEQIESQGYTDFVTPNKEAIESVLNEERPGMERYDEMYSAMIALSKIDAFKIELTNRKRIWEDSQRIVRETNNIGVLQHRCDAVLEFFKWLHSYIDAGVPIKVNMTLDETRADIARVFNNNALRIAKHIAERSDTARKAKNAIPKLTEIRNGLRPADNVASVRGDIDTLIFNLNIDANGK